MFRAEKYRHKTLHYLAALKCQSLFWGGKVILETERNIILELLKKTADTFVNVMLGNYLLGVCSGDIGPNKNTYVFQTFVSNRAYS